MSLCRLIYKVIEIPLINQMLFLFFIIDNQFFLLPHVWKLLEKPKSIPRLADREILCDNWIWMTVLYEKAILNYRFWNDLLNGLSLLNSHQMAFLWPTWFWENPVLVYDRVVLPHARPWCKLEVFFSYKYSSFLCDWLQSRRQTPTPRWDASWMPSDYIV